VSYEGTPGTFLLRCVVSLLVVLGLEDVDLRF
jgi:hypothetical protein